MNSLISIFFKQSYRPLCRGYNPFAAAYRSNLYNTTFWQFSDSKPDLKGDIQSQTSQKNQSTASAQASGENSQSGDKSDQTQKAFEYIQQNIQSEDKTQSSKTDSSQQINQNSQDQNKSETSEKTQNESNESNEQIQKAYEQIKSNLGTSQAQQLLNKIDLKQVTPQNALQFCIDAWKETFPDQVENTQKKMQQSKIKAQELKEVEEALQGLSQEQLAKLQEAIPQWKRTSLQISSENVQERETVISKLQDKLKDQINSTEFAKNLKSSEEYQEYTSFKKDVGQLKEDFKDHISHSQSKVVQGSLFLYTKATEETDVAKSIKQMRKYDPEFDLWELERDANTIFRNAYETYLRGELENLEKICGESALGYFQVLLKKREFDKCLPQYKELWAIEPAIFDRAKVLEQGLPYFLFTVKAQQIYCNLSLDGKQIIDGGDDRIMQMDYIFALTIHQSPDIEMAGHKWEIVELQPREVIKLLV